MLLKSGPRLSWVFTIVDETFVNPKVSTPNRELS